MSFSDNEYNRSNALPDGYQDDAEETGSPAKEKLLTLFVLLAAFAIIGYFQADSFKYIIDIPRRAYNDHIYNGIKIFAKDYTFKRALPGHYVASGRKTNEIDPRATHVAVYYISREDYAMGQTEQKCAIDDLQMTADGYYKMQLNIPKETWQILVYFTFVPENGELKGNYELLSDEIATNHKLIYFSDIRGDAQIVDKPQYNYLRTMKTYDAQGRETNMFAVGDKIHVEIIDYSNNFPNGLDRTSFLAEDIFSVYSQNPAVVSTKPKATEKSIVFDAVGPGEAEFLYADPFSNDNKWGKVTVKGKLKK
ncbi:MAG: hypothetical protein Q4F00_14070 [bacterium]|nr:hypothetical protein [bacterium]